MPKKNQNYEFIITFIVLLFQLVFLYAVKYLNQQLPFTDFSLLNIGNILNLLVYTGIITGIYFVIKKEKSLVSKKVIFSFIITSWLLLLLAFTSTRFKILSPGVYILNQPGDRVLTGLLFLLFLFTLLYFLILLWSRIFAKQKSKIIKNVLTTALMIIVSVVVTIIYIDSISYTSGRWAISKSEKNIAVVLGAAVWSGNVPSPTLSSRVDKALELLEQGFVGKIVLTGGKAPGELPESEVAYAYARAKEVDTSKVKIESLTSSTSDQIRWVKNNVSNDDSVEEIILISDAYHLPRTIEISKFYNLDTKVAESVHKLNFNDLLYNKIRESIALFIFWNFAL
jgi:vancomycin permeability regulator SanA